MSIGNLTKWESQALLPPRPDLMLAAGPGFLARNIRRSGQDGEFMNNKWS